MKSMKYLLLSLIGIALILIGSACLLCNAILRAPDTATPLIPCIIGLGLCIYAYIAALKKEK